jgi:protein-tyrosine-phosphatase
VVFWDIPDPAGQADDLVSDLYRQVQRKIEELVAQIG